MKIKKTLTKKKSKEWGLNWKKKKYKFWLNDEIENQ